MVNYSKKALEQKLNSLKIENMMLYMKNNDFVFNKNLDIKTQYIECFKQIRGSTKLKMISIDRTSFGTKSMSAIDFDFNGSLMRVVNHDLYGAAFYLKMPDGSFKEVNKQVVGINDKDVTYIFDCFTYE